jgi:predicted DNA-binding transcriptional regulator AlpA
MTLSPTRGRARLTARPERTRASAPHVANREAVANATSAADAVVERLFTEKDAANLIQLSTSWLAKARMSGDGPPYVKLGRSVRYFESTLLKWMRSRERCSTDGRQRVRRRGEAHLNGEGDE